MLGMAEDNEEQPEDLFTPAEEEAADANFRASLSAELQITNEVIQKLALLPEDGYQRVMAAISLFLDRDEGGLEYLDEGGSFRSTLRAMLPQFVAILGAMAKSGNNTAAYFFSIIDPLLQVVSADPDSGFKYQSPLTPEETKEVFERSMETPQWFAVQPYKPCPPGPLQPLRQEDLHQPQRRGRALHRTVGRRAHVLQEALGR